MGCKGSTVRVGSPRLNQREQKASSFFMSYYVYILKSKKDNKHYIGSTSDVNARIQYHNQGKQRSTKSRIPFELIYTEEYSTKTEAERREKEIKSYKGGNSFKKLIEGCGPA